MACGSYRQTRESDTRLAVSASRIDSHLGPAGEMNLTSGIIKTAASRTPAPSCWTNAVKRGDPPRSMIRRQIASRAFPPAAQVGLICGDDHPCVTRYERRRCRMRTQVQLQRVINGYQLWAV